ncbi:hypothetical protein ScPMuIL_007473 [Solemya velum]
MSAEPLFALLEVMLNLTTPKVTPGGYPEDIFVAVTEQDQEELICSICYQLLKETRQCVNRHRFCYNCIFVWSTSGPTGNHGRCPVCRVEGVYLRNKDIDNKIECKSVKCTMKSCDWIGCLKYRGSHKHTTYNKQNKSSGSGSEDLQDGGRNVNLPAINPNGQARKKSPPRHTNVTQHTITRGRQRPQPINQPAVSNSRSSSRSRSSQPINQQTVSTSRSSSRSQSIAGLESSASTTSTPRTPRPPTGPRPTAPRPTGLLRRRRPTLPSIANPPPQQNSTSETERQNSSSSSEDSSSDSTISNVSPRGGYGTIESRLLQSRNRLNSLMVVFTAELERGRQEIADFQEEREQRRQAQLDEVRDLGQRLGQVATELRRLLTERNTIRNHLDDITDS